MGKENIPEQVKRGNQIVQDTYEDSRGKNYTIRQGKNLVTATGMIRDAMLKTRDIKDRDTLYKHYQAQEMLFYVISLYAWAILNSSYKKELNVECAEQAISKAVAQVYQWVMDGNRTPGYRMFTRTSTTVRSRYTDELLKIHPENVTIDDEEGKKIDIPDPGNKSLNEMKEHLENLIIRLRDQEKLTEREKEVFCYKLGLCGYELLEKQGDIARKMNISDAAVSNAFKKGFAVLQDAASKDV